MKAFAEAEAPKLQPPDAKSGLNGKILILGKTEAKREGGSKRSDGSVTSLTHWT